MPPHARYTDVELVEIVTNAISEIKGDGLFYPDIKTSDLTKKIKEKYPDITRYYLDLPCCKEMLFRYNQERSSYIEKNLQNEKNARRILSTTNKADYYLKSNNYNVQQAFNAYEQDIAKATEGLFTELSRQRGKNQKLQEIISSKDNDKTKMKELYQKYELVIKEKDDEIQKLKSQINAYEKEKNELIRQAGMQVLYDINLSPEMNDNPVATQITYLDDLKKKLENKRKNDK